MIRLAVLVHGTEGSARPGGGGRLANRPVDGLRPERAAAPGAIAPALGAGRALPGRLWASRATSGSGISKTPLAQASLRGGAAKLQGISDRTGNASKPEAHP